MRTEQDFQRIFDELNVTPSQREPALTEQNQEFEICTVLRDVEITYGSSTEFQSDSLGKIEYANANVR